MLNTDYLEKTANNISQNIISDLSGITSPEELSNWKGGIRNILENTSRAIIPGLATGALGYKYFKPKTTSKLFGLIKNKPTDLDKSLARMKALTAGMIGMYPGLIYNRYNDINTLFPKASTERKLIYGFTPVNRILPKGSIAYLAGARKYKDEYKNV